MRVFSRLNKTDLFFFLFLSNINLFFTSYHLLLKRLFYSFIYFIQAYCFIYARSQKKILK